MTSKAYFEDRKPYEAIIEEIEALSVSDGQRKRLVQLINQVAKEANFSGEQGGKELVKW